MNYKVTHQTDYQYSEPMSLCHNEARLTPRSFHNQTCMESHLSVTPDPMTFREREDFFGNRTTCFVIEKPHTQLCVTATSIVRIANYNTYDALSGDSWETVGQYLRSAEGPNLIEVRQYALDSPRIKGDTTLAQYAKPCFTKDRPLLEAVADLTARIYFEFEYVPGFTTVATPISEVMTHKKGVCQDFAHLAIGCLRSLGLAARYISGYIETIPPPGKERVVGADASHAWFSVFIPGRGWVDFDPTNNLMPTDQHITVAWGRDFGDVGPLKGVLVGSGKHKLGVSVNIERLPDT
ncbi:MAG: transglutaminase family protein [bacterium]|nr:transglutaminase family protein [bacterium]